MLEGNFFKIKKVDESEGLIKAILEINPDHEIFKGHFPGQPVVPGVCMIEMIKELFERARSIRTRLVRSDQAKFLAMIDPRKISRIEAEIKYKPAAQDEIDISSSLFHESTTFLKFKAIFSTISP